MSDSPNPILNDRAYDKTKFIAQVVLPALGTLYFALASIWGLPRAEGVVGTIVAIDAFLGVLLGISNSQYNEANPVIDAGVLSQKGVDPETGMPQLHMAITETPDVLLSSKSVRLKVETPIVAPVPTTRDLGEDEGE